MRSGVSSVADDADGRFPGLAPVAEYFHTKTAGIFSVAGSPQARIVVDPARSVIGFRVPADGPLPDLARYSNLGVRGLEDEGLIWNELDLYVDSNVGEAYHLVCAALNRIQRDAATFSQAVSLAVEAVADLIEVRAGLSDERRIGLFGELLTIVALAGSQGGEAAALAWRGAEAEEHDFGLDSCDIEVKTTTSESRRHWISSRTQLEPTPGRPLHLLSIQITAGSPKVGLTLPELVALTRERAGKARQALDNSLTSYGYHDTDADLYRRRWQLRTAPVEYLVDATFPAVTLSKIAAHVPQPQRLLEIRYLLDVEGLPAASSAINFELLNTSSEDSP